MDVRCGFADVLDALQRVDRVGATEDAGSKNDGERIGRHPVGFLLQCNSVTQRYFITDADHWRIRTTLA